MRFPWFLLLSALAGACGSMGSAPTPGDAARIHNNASTYAAGAYQPLPRDLPWNDSFEAPADWATMPPADFERLVLHGLPEGCRTLLPKDLRLDLGRALDAMDQTSVRAAVILGRCGTEQAGNILFRRLQRRVLGPTRPSDAGDVVAAAALARFPSPERWHKIARLALGPDPHPDLEVRVECAASALQLGDERTIPFLLQVLRIGTYEGQGETLDFTPSETTAWARGRAAEALSEYVGLPLRYREDGPIAAREREARRLEERLLGERTQPSVPETAASPADLPHR